MDEILERLRVESCPTLYSSPNLDEFLELLKRDFHILFIDKDLDFPLVEFIHVPMPRSTVRVSLSMSSTGANILRVNFPNDDGTDSFSTPLINFSKARYKEKVFRLIIPHFCSYRLVYFSDNEKILLDVLRTYSIFERLESNTLFGEIYREACNKKKELWKHHKNTATSP